MTVPATFFQRGSFPGVLLPLSPEPSDAREGGLISSRTLSLTFSIPHTAESSLLSCAEGLVPSITLRSRNPRGLSGCEAPGWPSPTGPRVWWAVIRAC